MNNLGIGTGMYENNNLNYNQSVLNNLLVNNNEIPNMNTEMKDAYTGTNFYLNTYQPFQNVNAGNKIKFYIILVFIR